MYRDNDDDDDDDEHRYYDDDVAAKEQERRWGSVQRARGSSVRAGGEARGAGERCNGGGDDDDEGLAEQAELLEQLRQRRGPREQQLGAQFLGHVTIEEQLVGLVRHAAVRPPRLQRPLPVRQGGYTLASGYRETYEAEARGG